MPDHPVPKTEAEKQAARTALAKARELVDAGTTSQDAATFSCVDCLRWRGWVLAVLEGRESAWRAMSTPGQAARLTRKTHGDHARETCLARAEAADTEADAAYWNEVASLL